jgi:hypothetical protein
MNTATSQNTRQIYVLIDNQPQGPYLPEDVRKYLKSGQLQPTDQGAYVGSSDWKPLEVMVRSWGAAAVGPDRPEGAGPMAQKCGKLLAVVANRRFLPWPFAAWSWQRGLITLAWMAAVIALCYGVIDVLGYHAWNAYRRGYEAHGASLEAKTYIPKPITDSENFANTPFVQSWFKKNAKVLFDDDAYSRAGDMMGGSSKRRPGWKFEDLVAWQKAFAAVASGAAKPKDGFRPEDRDLASRADAAPAVLNGLADDADALEELRAASVRPGARYPVVYDMEKPFEILLPHLAKIKGTCQRLGLKADAELALGQNDQAFEDVKLEFYMIDSLKSEPFFISYLVRAACAQIAIGPIWEGLAEHRWTDAQLQQLQSLLESHDYMADLQEALHAERAFALLNVNLLKKHGLGTLRELKMMDSLLSLIIPSGWFDQEKLQYSLLFDSEFKETVDSAAKRVFPRKIADNERAWKSRTKNVLSRVIHHQLFASMMVPSLSRTPKRAASAKTAIDQASLACALERYRLANRQFPDDLEALVPRFIKHLPNDPFADGTYRYRPGDNGQFVLYSVGWNEKDDGGVPGKVMYDENSGDWVW